MSTALNSPLAGKLKPPAPPAPPSKKDGAVLLTTAGLAAGAAGLIAMLGAARILGVAEYGALGALLALAAVGDVWRASVQLNAARDVAQGITPREVQRRVLRRAVLVAAVIAAAAWPTAQLIDVGGTAAVVFVGMYVAAAGWSAARRGANLAVGRRRRAAAALLATATVRVVGSIAGATVAGVAGAVAGSVIAEIVGGFVSKLPSPFSVKPRTTVDGKSAFWLVAALAVAPPGLDSVLARLLLDQSGSGVYASAAALARGVLTVAQLLVTAAVPVMLADPFRAVTAVWKKVMAAVSVLAVGCAVAGPLTLHFVAGPQFVSPVTTMLLALAGISCSGTLLLCYAAHVTANVSTFRVLLVATSGVLLTSLMAVSFQVDRATGLASCAAVASLVQTAFAWLSLGPGTARLRVRRLAQFCVAASAVSIVASGVFVSGSVSTVADPLAAAALVLALLGSLLGYFSRPKGEVSTTVELSKRHRALSGLVAALLTGAVTFFTWFDAGKFYNFFDITVFERRGLSDSLWQTWGYEWSGAGGPTWESGRIWEVGFYHFGRLVGDVTIGQRLYWAAVVALCAGGVAVLCARFAKHWATAALAGVLAAWNGFFIVYNRNPANYVVAGLAAISLALAIDAARGRKLRPLMLASLTLPCSYLGVNPPLLMLMAAWFVLTPFIAAVVCRTGRRGVGRALMQWARALPATVIGAAWWVLPWLITAQTSRQSGTVRAITDPVQYRWAVRENSIPNVLAFTANFSWPDYRYFRDAIGAASPAVVWTAFLISAAAFSLPLFRRRSKAAWLTPAVLVVLVFLSKGLHEPLSAVNAFLYKVVPGMFLLRQPMAKIGPFLVVVAAIAAALAAEGALRRATRYASLAVRRRRRPRRSHAHVASLMVVGLVASLLSAYPLWNGSIVPHAKDGWPGGRVAVPQNWYKVAEKVNAAGDAKVLVLPLVDMYMLPTTWGGYAWDNLARQLFTRPVLMRNPDAYITDPAPYELQMRAAETALFSGDVVTAEMLLRRLGVSTVVIRKDVAYNSQMRIVRMREYQPLLKTATELKDARTIISTDVADVIQLPPASSALGVNPVSATDTDIDVVRIAAPTVDDPSYPKATVLRGNAPRSLAAGEYELRRVANGAEPPVRQLIRRPDGQLVLDDLAKVRIGDSDSRVSLVPSQELGEGDVVIVDRAVYRPGQLVRMKADSVAYLADTVAQLPLSAPVACSDAFEGPVRVSSVTLRLDANACAKLSFPSVEANVVRLRYRITAADVKVDACLEYADGSCTRVEGRRVALNTAEFHIVNLGLGDDPVALRVYAKRGAVMLSAAAVTPLRLLGAPISLNSLFPRYLPRVRVKANEPLSVPGDATALTKGEPEGCASKPQPETAEDGTMHVVYGTCSVTPVGTGGQQALRVRGTISGEGTVRICLTQSGRESCRMVTGAAGSFEVSVPPVGFAEPAAQAAILVLPVRGDSDVQLRINMITVDPGYDIVAVPSSAETRELGASTVIEPGEVQFVAPARTALVQLLDTENADWVLVDADSNPVDLKQVVVDGWAQAWIVDESVVGTPVTAKWSLEHFVTLVRLQSAVLAVLAVVCFGAPRARRRFREWRRKPVLSRRSRKKLRKRGTGVEAALAAEGIDHLVPVFDEPVVAIHGAVLGAGEPARRFRRKG